MRFNKILKTGLCLALAVSMMFSPSSISIAAEETSEAVTEFTVDEHFVPFRSEIPNFLAKNSSIKSNLVKSLWAKVFWEEKADSNAYVSRNHGIDSKTGEEVPIYYTGIDAEPHQLTEKITYATNSFEAFFGNTIKNNPEFLGQMLGLPGDKYEPLGESDAANAYMKEVMCNYLLNANKYTHFPNAVIKLTKDGMYLDGSLNSVSSNGIRADYCMLATIASRYGQKDKDGKNYLSDTQIEWVESYQLELYDAYTLGNNATLKNLVTNNYNLLDLIARSSYAANDRNGWGYNFFNWIVGQEKGGEGAFLQKNNNINILGLDTIDDVSSIFATAAGWCRGYCDSSCGGKGCADRNKCLNKGEDVERLASMLFHNSTAMSFFKNQENTKAIYEIIYDEGAYAERHEAKHQGVGPIGKYRKLVRAGGDIHVYDYESKGLHEGYNSVSADTNNSRATDYTGNGRTLRLDSRAFTSSGQEYIEVQVGQSDYTERTKTITSWSLKINGVEVANKSNQRVAQADFVNNCMRFNIIGISPTQRAAASLEISFRDTGSYDGTWSRHGASGIPREWNSIDTSATIKCSGEVYVSGNYPPCIADNHKWAALESNGTLKWKDTEGVYSHAEVHPYCSYNCGKTQKVRTLKSVRTEDNNYLYYTATDKATQLTIMKRVSKTSGLPEEDADLSKATAPLLVYGNWGTEKVWPAGSVSQETYKHSSVRFKNSLPSGCIKTGLTKLKVDITGSEVLTYLDIRIMSASGEVLAKNVGTLITPDSSQHGHNDIYTNYHDVYIPANVTSTDLDGAYVIIEAKADTQHWTNWNSPQAHIDDVISSIKLNNIKFYY